MATNAGFVIQQGIFLCKTETTIGTDAVPTVGSNALVIEEINIQPLGQSESQTRQPLMGPGIIGVQTPVAGKRHAKLSFKIPVVGAAGAGTAVNYAPVLKACALAETLTASTSAAYSDGATTVPCTIYVYAGPAQGTTTWRLYKFLGVAGNVKMTGEDGKAAMWEFDMMGAYVEPTDVSAPSSPALVEVVPTSLLGVTLSLNWGSAYTPVCKSWEIDFGGEVVMREDMAQLSGYRAGIMKGRIPKFSFDIEEDLAANFNPYAYFAANTPGSITIGPVGPGGGSPGLNYTISIPRAGIEKPDPKAQDGLMRMVLAGQCARNVSTLSTAAVSATFT